MRSVSKKASHDNSPMDSRDNQFMQGDINRRARHSFGLLSMHQFLDRATDTGSRAKVVDIMLDRMLSRVEARLPRPSQDDHRRSFAFVTMMIEMMLIIIVTNANERLEPSSSDDNLS